MEGSSEQNTGAAGSAQEVANNLVNAAREAASTGANLVQDSGNAGVDAVRAEAGTLLGAVGETLQHLAQLFNDLKKAVVGE